MVLRAPDPGDDERLRVETADVRLLLYAPLPGHDTLGTLRREKRYAPLFALPGRLLCEFVIFATQHDLHTVTR